MPLVGINSGRCFAGNAAILGCCDVVIATANSNIGMGGPAMVEGGGLGVFTPDEIGPMTVQVPNGVVDIPVADEAEAVAVAKQYLSYFHGPTDDWQYGHPNRMRDVVPENRLRVYDSRDAVHAIADDNSVLEIREHFGLGMVTALIRVEGRPLGVVANNPTHLAGAIDADGADKAARFMQLCDAFDIPLLQLCDTPGIMVGPEVEKTALVRHVSRMFVVGANVTVPTMTIVLRKGYGLGAMTMAAGCFKSPIFTVSWPTGEFGGMGLEGAVRLGYRRELEAIEDDAEREATFNEMVERMYTTARRSTRRATSRSTTSSTLPTVAAGSCKPSTPPAPRHPAPVRNAPTSIPGESDRCLQVFRNHRHQLVPELGRVVVAHALDDSESGAGDQRCGEATGFDRHEAVLVAVDRPASARSANAARPGATVTSRSQSSGGRWPPGRTSVRRSQPRPPADAPRR